jgi:hypothetical protein
MRCHWKEQLLRLELGDLQAAGFDLALTGFDQDELDRRLVVETELDGDPDDAPDPPAEPISKPGDLWIYGDYRVLRGEATVLADVERVLGGELADMTFTDPPYSGRVFIFLTVTSTTSFPPPTSCSDEVIFARTCASSRGAISISTPFATAALL